MKKSEALKILGLSEGATDDEIKQAHRKLVIAHHPDKFAFDSPEHAAAEEKTKRINEARDVLINRSWTPEFDPRRDARPYVNPYAHPSNPYGRPPQPGAPGQGTGAGDPFAGTPFAGWPFAGEGHTTYVWTSWDGVHTAGDGRSEGGNAWPFDPFAPFRGAAPEPTPTERLAQAKRDLVGAGVVVALKAALLVVLALTGSAASGLFLYFVITFIYGLWKRFGTCLIGFFFPLLVVFGPIVILLAPKQGMLTPSVALVFAGAVLYDLVNLRRLIRAYRAAKQTAAHTS